MQRQGSKESQNRRVDHTHDPDGIVHDHKEHNTTAALRMFRMAFPKELYASKFWAAATDGCDIGILFGLRQRMACTASRTTI